MKNLIIILAGILHGGFGLMGQVPADSGFVEVSGTELYYVRLGEGEPVVVVHGGPMLDHGYLRPWLDFLSRDHELIYFDQRLNGRSSADVDTADVSVDQMVKDIEGIRQAFGYDRIHLLGHSWGGLLAARYATMYPEHLHSLILISPVPANNSTWRSEEAQIARRFTEADVTERQAILASDEFREDFSNALDKLLRISLRIQMADRDQVEQLTVYIPDDYQSRAEKFGVIAPELNDYDFRKDLSEADVPVLLVYGDQEPAATMSGPEYLEGFPDATLEVIPEAGHFTFLERQEDFRKRVRKFLHNH